uniref:LCP family protein n=1 Tax=Selenomonas sp. TAMA-11512 TaxID=3095337 RepID=UPI00403F5A86
MDIKGNRGNARSKKSGGRWKIVLVLVIVFFAALAAGVFFAQSGLLDKKEDPQKKEEEMLVAKDKAIIMIMGVDQREDDIGRSDTLMVAAIDPKKDQASLLSIPRDTRVKIKGYGYDKINAAYAYGGRRLTQNTVEDFLGVRMDHYILINTQAFQKIIDAIGGVDIDVENRMYYEDPWDDDGGLVIDLYPGMQHMDGKTAVTYVRYRDEEGDIGRIARQQKFMRAVMDQVTSPSILPKIPSVIAEIVDSVETDLTVRQMVEFAGSLKNAQKHGLHTEMVPGRPLYIDEISYWIPDILGLRRALANTLDVVINASMKAAMERTSIEYENSIPADASEVPAGDTSIGREVKAKIRDEDERKSGDTRESRTARKRKAGEEKPAVNGNGDSAEERRSTENAGAGERESSSRREGAEPVTPSGESKPPVAPTPVPGASPAGKTQ